MKMLAQYYDEIYKFNDEQLIIEQLSKSGGPLLDLGCGTGRTLVSAVKNGFNVTGVDFDKDMLIVARNKLSEVAKEGGKFELIFGDMLNLDIAQKKFGTIASMANTFSLLTTSEDRIKMLRQCSIWLKDKGNILLPIIKLNNTSGDRTSTVETPEGKLTFKVRWVNKNDIREFNLKLDLNEKHEEYNFETAILQPEMFLPEIDACDLEMYALYGDFQKNKISNDSTYWIYCLKKKNIQ
ncbi:MAG: class I SAM-dependent methyltransferase [Oligoflexia bacterium]|nr:class I SAM-dependent methyltransferase [Oligoflexia bacterium]